MLWCHFDHIGLLLVVSYRGSPSMLSFRLHYMGISSCPPNSLKWLFKTKGDIYLSAVFRQMAVKWFQWDLGVQEHLPWVEPVHSFVLKEPAHAQYGRWQRSSDYFSISKMSGTRTHAHDQKIDILWALPLDHCVSSLYWMIEVIFIHSFYMSTYQVWLMFYLVDF